MQLFKKSKNILWFFIAFLKSTLNSEQKKKKKKKDGVIASEIIDAERRGYLNT